MDNSSSRFTIYNASAGSGKTYTLVRSFLLVLLRENTPSSFKQLLAITFTNKAVAQMKERIISTLRSFARMPAEHSQGMFAEVASLLGVSQKELSSRAKMALQYILQNYTALSISTIDSFNQRLIRSFAFELRLNPEFEVSIDTDTLIRLAVDRLLEQVGTQPALTQWLLDFACYKAASNKDWDIKNDLIQIAYMATQEMHFFELEALATKDITHFMRLRDAILERLAHHRGVIEASGKEFEAMDLPSECFQGGYLYKFFLKAKNTPTLASLADSFAAGYFAQAKAGEFLSEAAKKKKPAAVELLVPHTERIIWLMERIEHSHGLHTLLTNALYNFLPLAVLSYLYKTIEDIKQEEGILPIYEFNRLIYQKIAHESTPFLYEKLGQRYRYFFIDEFQDTSALQWANFLPLASEGVSQQDGGLMLVGDAKQSIYRWRGGLASQFIALYNHTSQPFASVAQTTIKLESNYRSFQEVIRFNNRFFEYLSQSQLFTNKHYQDLYGDAPQLSPPLSKSGGYVSITFLGPAASEGSSVAASLIELHTERVKHLIDEEVQRGFAYQDICVLTRTNREGSYIAAELSRAGLPVISSEALLLSNSAKIRFLMLLLKLTTYHTPPLHSQSKAALLLSYQQLCFEREKMRILREEASAQGAAAHSFLNTPVTQWGREALLQAQQAYSTDIDATLSTYMHLSIEEFLSDKGVSLSTFYQYSLYDGLCYLIKALDMADSSDAYLSHLLSIAQEFTTNRRHSLTDFLQHWEHHQQSLSVSVPDGTNAVRVMTIHKSKGLEFPIVIYPLANSSLAPSSEFLWCEVSPDWELPADSPSHLLLTTTKAVRNALPDVALLQAEAPLLEQVNVLYVALTRAQRHLHVLTSLAKPSKGADKDTDDTHEEYSISDKSYCELFKGFLVSIGRWRDTDELYTFGAPTFAPPAVPAEAAAPLPFVLFGGNTPYAILTSKGLMWNSSSAKAIERGNIMHTLLSKIKYSSDVPSVVSFAVRTGVVPFSLRKELQAQLMELCLHPQLSDYFTPAYSIHNERDLLTSSGTYLRPDRLALCDDGAVVIDYKTGHDHSSYAAQLRGYRHTLLQMGYTSVRCLLVFIGEGIAVREVA